MNIGFSWSCNIMGCMAIFIGMLYILLCRENKHEIGKTLVLLSDDYDINEVMDNPNF